MKVLIVIPTLNESKNISNLIFKIAKNPNLQILVIDDNSKDKTEFLIRQFSRENHKVRLISYARTEKNQI